VIGSRWCCGQGYVEKWCLLSVVCNVSSSDVQIVMDGTPNDGVNVNKVDLVGGDMLGRL